MITIITSKELSDVAKACGIKNMEAIALIADSAYALPSYNWVEDQFSTAWKRLREFMAIDEYKDEMNDCDDFARMCAAFAQSLHSRTLKSSKALNRRACALAFGEFWYFDSSLHGYHAINAFLYRDEMNGIVRLGYYEPQTATITALPNADVWSCTMFRI